MYKIIYDTQKSVKIIKFLPDCVKNCSKKQINSKKLLKNIKKVLTSLMTYGKLRISLKERRNTMNFMVNLLVIISILVISIILLAGILGIGVVIRNSASLHAGKRKSSWSLG